MSSTTIQLPEKTASAVFGFLSVIELPSLGFCGGLLVVSSIGRPIEFHCTAPVTPNRTQQIIYGQTYRGFLFADQIAEALIDKLKQPPAIYVSDCPELLPLNATLAQPLILIESLENNTDSTDDSPNFVTDHHRCWCPELASNERGLLEHHVKTFASKLPLDEPVERIAQAVEEAHSVLRAG